METYLVSSLLVAVPFTLSLPQSLSYQIYLSKTCCEQTTAPTPGASLTNPFKVTYAALSCLLISLLPPWLPAILAADINSSTPGQIGSHLGRQHFQSIFSNEHDKIRIQISLKLIPRSPIVNKPALVQGMAWCRTADKPLPVPYM